MLFIELLFFKFSLQPSQKLRHLGNSPAHHKMKLFFQFFSSSMHRGHIFQPKSLRNSFYYFYFLTDGIYQRKTHLWKKDSQRNPRKPASCADIQHLCAISKRHYFGNSKRMQNVLFIKPIHIFSGNDIYFLVPFGV